MDRILYSNNGILSDLSYELENYHSESASLNFVAAEDKIYIGSRYPFNSKYLKVDTANAVSSSVSFKYYDGNQFRAVVDTIDETAVSGATLNRSGHVTFVPNQDYAWVREDSTDITEINTVTVYGMFWLEVSFSADIAFELSWIGNLFNTTNDIAAEYPDLVRSNMLIAWEAGKTDWEEQSVIASSLIVDDLVTQGVISSANQLLERRVLRSVAVAKTAELIYTGLGDDYEDQRNVARGEYKKRLHKDLFKVDKNGNGMLDLVEEGVKQGRMHR